VSGGMPDQRADRGGWPAERRRRAGKVALNRGLVALAIAAGGWVLGFLIPALTSTGSTGGRAFFPIGGIASAFVAVSAILIGTRVRRFVNGLSTEQRMLVAPRWDMGRQVRFATLGIALGVASIVCNPLIGFVVLATSR